MNISQLGKVIEKLRYYKVDKEIDDLPNYLKNLTPKEIENIISMDFDREHNEFTDIDWIEIFDNHDLLSFDNFYECLNIIFNDLVLTLSTFEGITRKEILDSKELCGSSLFGIIINEDARNSKLLLDDMRLIVNKIKKLSDIFQYKTTITSLDFDNLNRAKKIIRIMCQIATNEVSLKGSTHCKVMETLFDMEPNEDDFYIAECLEKVECFEPANNFSYHSKGLDLIMTSKTHVIAKVLTEVQLSEIVYENPEDFLINDLKLIHNSKTDIIADCLGTVAINAVPIKDLSFKRLLHNADMKKISLSSTDVIAKCLSAVARNKPFIEGGNHVKYIDIIFKANSDEEALAYTRVILNDKNVDVLDKVMFNAISFVDDQPDKNIELPTSVFKIAPKE